MSLLLLLFVSFAVVCFCCYCYCLFMLLLLLLFVFMCVCCYCDQEKAMMRDVILAIRADEAHHRVVNHTLSSLDHTSTNPHSPGK